MRRVSSGAWDFRRLSRVDKPTRFDEEVDWLVFGSGAAGLCAALVGRLEGLDVLLCEKTPLIGGTTATSGGTIWVPGSHQSQLTPTPDDLDSARRYLEGELGNDGASELREALLSSGPAMLDYLESKTEVRFKANSPYPDYHAERPGGAQGGRALSPLPFDGRLLGADFAMLRPPRDEFMVLGGMMVGRDEIRHLIRPWRSLQSLRIAARIVGRYARDRLSYRRGTRLLLGNALVGRLLYSYRNLGGRVALNTALQELCVEGGRVLGATVQADSGVRRIRARRGVVLATGGPSSSASWRERLLPGRDLPWSLAFDGNTGDGLDAGLAIGAVLDTRHDSPFFWMPASRLDRSGLPPVVYPHIRDRPKPGLIAVRDDGKRFVNEGNSYHDFVSALFAASPDSRTPHAWLICDRAFVRDFGLGVIHPVWQHLPSFERAGYLVSAATLESLAGKTGIDAQALRSTVMQYNDDASAGRDRAFGKGELALNRYNGDPDTAPNRCLRPIEAAPFYAVRVIPAPIGSSVGLLSDADARVLDDSRVPIEGLYACGNDMSSVMGGHYPGPGITLGPAMVFAYRAARHAAADRG